MGLLSSINFLTNEYWRRRRWLIYGTPPRTKLQKAMKAYEQHPTQANKQKVEQLLKTKQL